jgi:hypothetical protein
MLLFSFLVMSVQGQSTLKTKAPKTVNATTWAWNQTVGVADSLGVVQDSIIQTIKYEGVDSVRQYIKVKLTEVSSPARVIVKYQTKKYDSDSYTDQSTITYTGVGTDSTIYIKDNGAYKDNAYKRLLFIRVNNKSYISHLSGYVKK